MTLIASPVDRIAQVIGEDHRDFIRQDFTDKFFKEIEWSNVCINAANKQDAPEYKKRYMVADYIAITTGLDTEDVDRAKVFLHLLLDI